MSNIPVVLLAFANDADAPLRELAKEQDELMAALDQPRRDGKCRIETLAAATPAKIIEIFQRYAGQICVFHYGGHASEEALFLRKDYPGQGRTEATHLAEFLAVQQNLELVFINGCLSEGQVEAYHSASVKAVIATDRVIGDEAAREFAKRCYLGLAGGATISEAFQAAEAAYKTQHGEVPRGSLILPKAEDATGVPWQLFPAGPHSWRLPLLAQRLTRIPTIDLEKEFLGREADLARLKETLENSYRVVLMNGLGGIGKTVLATAYVQQYGKHYDHIAWINRGEDLIETVALNESLADTLGIPFQEKEELETRFRRIMRALDQLPGQNLLVIDNAQEQVAEKAIYEQLPGLPNWRVLLTSRLSLGGFEEVSIGILEPESAVALFRTWYREAVSEADLTELLEEIGYHTLTIELLAKLLDKLNGILSVADLTATLRERQLDDPDLQEKIWTQHSKEERGIYLHLMKAFELSNLTEKEIWMLKQFVVLPAEGYSVQVLAELTQQKSLEVNGILNELISKGWLTRRKDKTIEIHPLVRTVASYKVRVGIEEANTLIVSLCQKTHMREFEDPMVMFDPWLRYGASVEEYFSDAEEGSLELASLQNNLARLHQYISAYHIAKSLFQRSIKTKEVLVPNSEELAFAYSNLAVVNRILAESDEAYRNHKLAIAIREDISSDPSCDNDLAQSYHNFSVFCIGLDDIDQAEKFQDKAINIRYRIYPTDHPYMASSYLQNANILHSKGEYDDAIKYYTSAIILWEQDKNPNPVHLGTAYNNLGKLHEGILDYRSALEWFTIARKIRMNIGSNSYGVGESYHNIGQCLMHLQKYHDALNLFERARLILEPVLSDFHPIFKKMYNNLAITYRALKQPKKAAIFEAKADATGKQ